MKNKLLASSICAVVLFVWGFLSWAVLPWHNSVANRFTDESAVSQALKGNAPVAGIYYLPFSEEDHRQGEAAAFVNVLPNGFDMDMGKLMGQALLGQFVAAMLVVLLLGNTSGLSYSQRVGFVSVVGVTIGFVSHFPYWNWFGFSTGYVSVVVLDSLVAWTLAGIVMAKFITGRNA